MSTLKGKAFTAKMLAKKFNITFVTFKKWVAVGFFPEADIDLGERKRFYSREIVEEFMEQNCICIDPIIVNKKILYSYNLRMPPTKDGVKYIKKNEYLASLGD